MGRGVFAGGSEKGQACPTFERANPFRAAAIERLSTHVTDLASHEGGDERRSGQVAPSCSCWGARGFETRIADGGDGSTWASDCGASCSRFHKAGWRTFPPGADAGAGWLHPPYVRSKPHMLAPALVSRSSYNPHTHTYVLPWPAEPNPRPPCASFFLPFCLPKNGLLRAR